MVYAQPSICPWKWDAQTSLGFWDTTDHLILVRWPYLEIINKKKKKRTSRIVNFAIWVDHKVKLKESEKKDKYLDLARKLKKNVEHESTATKGLIQGQEDLEIRVETIQTTPLLKSDRILRRIQVTCCHSNYNERPSANADVKNSQGVTLIIIIIMQTGSKGIQDKA